MAGVPMSPVASKYPSPCWVAAGAGARAMSVAIAAAATAARTTGDGRNGDIQASGARGKARRRRTDSDVRPPECSRGIAGPSRGPFAGAFRRPLLEAVAHGHAAVSAGGRHDVVVALRGLVVIRAERVAQVQLHFDAGDPLARHDVHPRVAGPC